MLKKHPNTPAHLFLDDAPYFLTSAIYQHRRLLSSATIKNHLLMTIQNCVSEKGWSLTDWVILDEHYHLLVVSHKGEDLNKIIGKIHMLSAKFIGEQIHAEKPIWYNYWDYCPRTDRDYLIRQNYLFNNPVKHGYVKNLYDYPFSSFHQQVAQWGREVLVKRFKENSEYRSLQLEEDNF